MPDPNFSPETIAALRAYGEALGATHTKQKEANAAVREFIKVMGPGGVTQGLSTFSEGLVNISGRLTNFTKLTTLSEGSLKNWAGVVATAVQGAGSFLDVMDRMEKLQGNLQRSFGLSNVSTRAFYENLAKGAEIGGTAGMKSMEEITRAMLEQRREGNITDASFQKLTETYTKFALGLSANFPADFVRMQQQLGMNANDITDSYEALAFTAAKARIPFEQFKDAVFTTSEQFVGFGVKLPEVQGAFNLFVDDISKGTYTIQEVQKTIGDFITMQKTAGGIQQRAIMSHFLSQHFEELPAELQTALGGERFKTAPATEKTSAIAQLSPEMLMKAGTVMGSIVEKMPQATNLEKTMQLMKSLTGMEYAEFLRLKQAVTPGTPAGAVTTMGQVAPPELDKWRASIDKAADLNKEWYSFMTKWLQEAKGLLGDLGPAGKIGATIASGIGSGVVQALLMRGMGGMGGRGIGAPGFGGMSTGLGAGTAVGAAGAIPVALTVASGLLIGYSIGEAINASFIGKGLDKLLGLGPEKPQQIRLSETTESLAAANVQLVQLRELVNMREMGTITPEMSAQIPKLTEKIRGAGITAELNTSKEISAAISEITKQFSKGVKVDGVITIDASPDFNTKIEGNLARLVRESSTPQK